MKARFGVLAVLSVSYAQGVLGQLEVGGSLMDNCAQIEAARKSGDLAGARAKADACLQALDQELQGQVGNQFPADVAGWKRTGIEQNQALGFNNVSATYQKGETSATVSLTGSAGGGGGGPSLGGLLGGLAKMGLQAGQQIRVGGLPAAVQADGTIAVTLDNGSFLTFVSSSFHDQQQALAGLGDLVNAFPVANINKMLK